MATELVTFKMDDKFLEEVDETVKAAGYQNRTELIRAALREKVDDIKLKKAMKEVSKMWGKAPRKTTNSDIEKVREKVAREFEKKFSFR
ncbi:MAG: ribbon-helix-helix protein, CopG family [Candidatus Woesearchaeota archaeon]